MPLLLSSVYGLAIRSNNGAIVVPDHDSAPATLLSSFLSLSYELIDFPDYAGTRAAPNQYSVNLLEAIAEKQVYMPVARVGGNSQ